MRTDAAHSAGLAVVRGTTAHGIQRGEIIDTSASPVARRPFEAPCPPLPWARGAAFASTAERLLRDLASRPADAPWPSLLETPRSTKETILSRLVRRRDWEIASLRDGRIVPLAGRPGSTLADPFPFHHRGQDWLFFEEQTGARPGILSVARLHDHGIDDVHVDIIPSTTHRSWPNVFEAHGEIWMLPESSADSEVALWRCLSFPDRWVRERTLLSGRRHLDPTLLHHDGIWWLFTSEAGPSPHSHSDSLLLHWSEDLWNAPFHPHPWNPVAVGLAGSRPAGRVHLDETGTPIRPAQDCTGRYGRAIVLRRIEELTTTRYRESTVAHLPPPPGFLGMHTWNPHGTGTIVDLLASSPRLRWPFRQGAGLRAP